MTVVVSADQGHVFHNRLTHSLQVAQLGRRIAEKLRREIKAGELPEADLSPNVVEAACLAHDLGHPPFGHIAESALNELAAEVHLSDGFEGNAQSFRIVTKLAVGSSRMGLNLTRATLNAILKYPWLRGENPKYPNKWGAYESERGEFDKVRELGTPKNAKSVEADIMDWADDITYSVHDIDDFFRAGVIPLDRLGIDDAERERFYAEVFARKRGKFPEGLDETYLRGAFDGLIKKSPLVGAGGYQGTGLERIRMRNFTSALIGEFVRGLRIRTDRGYPYIWTENRRVAEVFMLKELTWHYVIKNPALATHQEGQRTIIRELFYKYFKAATSRKSNLDLFPASVRELLPEKPASSGSHQKVARVIIDFISGLTEEQAVALHHRIHGVSLGSALAYDVR